MKQCDGIQYLIRKYFYTVIIISCVAIVSCRNKSTPSAEIVPASTVTWTNTNGELFALYTPAAPEGASVPVVMYLHGYTEDPINNPPWFINSLNAIEPCAVFLPYRSSSEGASAWGGTYDVGLRQSMIDTLAEFDALIQTHNLNSCRQYICGDSMGGEGVLKLLVEYPNRFAGAVSVAGYTVTAGADAMAIEMAKTPLWLIWGAADTDLNVQDLNIYNLIVASGGTHVKMTEYPGLGHVESIYAAQSEPGLCAWLLAQRLP